MTGRGGTRCNDPTVDIDKSIKRTKLESAHRLEERTFSLRRASLTGLLLCATGNAGGEEESLDMTARLERVNWACVDKVASSQDSPG